jgi:opacity protein-like surface antigen
MSRLRAFLLTLIIVAVPMPAFAYATGFLGTITTPSNHGARGFGIGFGLLIVAFEFEYSGSSEDEEDLAPALRTFMGNVLLQTPFEIFGFQPYFTTGGGVYRESLEVTDHQETNVGFNTGGGVKIGLIGPLRLRLDYRVFKLSGDALHSTAHRLYAGLNLKF